MYFEEVSGLNSKVYNEKKARIVKTIGNNAALWAPTKPQLAWMDGASLGQGIAAEIEISPEGHLVLAILCPRDNFLSGDTLFGDISAAIPCPAPGWSER